MLTLKSKRDLIVREFEQINVNHDNFISREELYQYLDLKAIFSSKLCYKFFFLFSSVIHNSTEILLINYMKEWIKTMMVVSHYQSL